MLTIYGTRMFIFLLTPSNTKDYYYSNQISNQLFRIKFLTKKYSKYEEKTFHSEFIFVSISYFIRAALSKKLVKSRISEKYKKG